MVLSTMERGCDRCGQYGGGSYPPYPREDRDQPERAALPQGSLGRGL